MVNYTTYILEISGFEKGLYLCVPRRLPSLLSRSLKRMKQSNTRVRLSEVTFYRQRMFAYILLGPKNNKEIN